MAEFNYKDSSHKFTAPVRKFKANDPYYYEVDNIPLGQLEENDMWLRDQIIGTGGTGTTGGEIGRAGFSELKPYAPGGSNTVRIKPGRYTARINDAYDKKGQQLSFPHLNVYDGQMGAGGLFWGGFLGDGDKNSQWWSPYQTDTTSPAWAGPEGDTQYYFRELLNQNFNKLKSGVATNALFMNGLGDRLLSHMVDNVGLGGGGIWLTNSPGAIGTGLGLGDVLQPQDLTAASLDGAASYGYPLLDKGITSSPSYTDLFLKLANRFATDSFADLSYVAAEFTKRWSGAVRTAVVDVPVIADQDYALEVTIPPFNQTDFYYVENGKQQITQSITRFDLVFIYSKPIDASSATVIDNSQETKARVINKPQLGVVVGAGLAVNFDKLAGSNNVGWPDPTTGNIPPLEVSSFNQVTSEFRSTEDIGGINGKAAAYMLPSVADSVNTAGGFTLEDGTSKLMGSFPSPDDLMNLTPDFVNDIQDDDARLIGQSILPVAYIRRNANTITVSPDDVIDIRPFFRTTELSYNERAGIAAATPSLSFANPAVGKTELLRHFKHFTQALNLGQTQGTTGPSDNATLSNTPRVIGGGIIWGGKKYGPEGALTGGTPGGTGGEWGGGATNWDATQMQGVEYANVPDTPDWDIADWCLGRFGDSTTYAPGQLRNDRIFQKYTQNYQMTASEATQHFTENLDFSDDPHILRTQWIDNLATNSVVQGGNYIYSMTGKSGTGGFADGFHHKEGAPYQMYWVQKRINFGQLPAAFRNYDVECNFVNCVPLGWPGLAIGEFDIGANAPHEKNPSQAQGFWIEKGDTYFIIHLAFIGPGAWYYGSARGTVDNAYGWKLISDNDVGRQAVQTRTFAVVNSNAGVVNPDQNAGLAQGGGDMKAMGNVNTNPDALSSQGFASNFNWAKVGSCTYPTVQFKVTGYPIGWASFYGTGLGGAWDGNSSITLG